MSAIHIALSLCLVVKDEGPLEDRRSVVIVTLWKKNGDGEHLQN